MIYLRIVFATILALFPDNAHSSALHRINQLKEFAQVYGMRIDVCEHRKITCTKPLETGCSSIPQRSSISPFVIAISLKATKGKIQVLGTVKSKIKNVSYVKYIVEAREVDKKTGAVGKRIGKFLNYNEGHGHSCFTTITCSADQKQDVGMSCPDAKTSKNFQWMAPQKWKGEIQFKVTIIKSSAEFWVVNSDVVLIA